MTLALTRSNRVVGLGSMLYPGEVLTRRYSERLLTHETYLGSLVIFAEWLLNYGYDIKLFLGDDDTT